MLKEFLVVFLLCSVIFFSGCTNNQTTPEGETTNLTAEELENQALAEIEKEMEQAIENMSMEDLEDAIVE